MLEVLKNALIPITHSVEEILNADVDVFVELMGGVDEAFKIVSEFKKKKLLLLQIKLCLLIIVMNLKIWLNLAFGYEASVAGGILLSRF